VEVVGVLVGGARTIVARSEAFLSGSELNLIYSFPTLGVRPSRPSSGSNTNLYLYEP
jgi:hypothetical protein